MRIVIAPNAFKGSMSSIEVAEAMSRGIKRVSAAIEVDCVPVADGGDGLIDVLAQAFRAEMVTVTVADPLYDDIPAQLCYVRKSQTAVVEMARASGLVLIPEKMRDPECTTTFGTGQLIKKCLDLEVRRLIVGLGGSATCDGGIGAAAAVGYSFLDRNSKVLLPTGGNLGKICSIDTSRVDRRLQKTVIEAACDVSNPLYGEKGASYVYSPQKGARPDQVKRLDDGLRNLAAVVKKDMGVAIDNLPGSGAAGGLGGGLHVFFGAKLKKGIDLVIDVVDLPTKVKGADLVITGEGRIDFQTQYDKAPAGVARVARSAGLPCVAICGSRGRRINELHDIGVTAIFSICQGPQDLESSLAHATKLIEDAAEQVIRFFVVAKDGSVTHCGNSI